MKFFDREREIELLREYRERSSRTAQFSVITGRRRVGKTELIRKAYEGDGYVYLFVERKNERDLCENFQSAIESALIVPIYGTMTTVQQVLEFLFTYAESNQLTLIIDEFQELLKVNKSIYSTLQKLWDIHKNKMKINLIVSGSVNTLMHKIFLSKKASLYGRQTAFLRIDPFKIEVLKQILAEYSPGYTNEDLLALWTFTGGVAKYVEIFMDHGATTKDDMLSLILREDSFFLDEGKAVLAEEFDKEYGTYFSILSAISRGRNTRSEIEQAIGRHAGGYLTRLESDYSIIKRKQPLFAKQASKNSRYMIDDRFLLFWFRFIYRFGFLVEIRAFDQLQDFVKRDYNVFSGFALERYFQCKFAESGTWTMIGNWWDRKGENEIDLIAEDELSGRIVIGEVKREKERVDLKTLRLKFDTFVKASGKYKRIKPNFIGLSMEDM